MRRIRMRRAITEALDESMSKCSSVYLIGEDLSDPWGGTYNVTRGLSTKFGLARVIDAPIVENTFVGMAIGSALSGMRPVVELMYMDFALLAADQIVNQAAKMRYMTGGQVSVPIVFRMPLGGYKSSAAQHGQSLEAWFAHIPGLVVVYPSNPMDAKLLLKSAIELNDPVVFLEHKDMYNDAGHVEDAIEANTAEIGRASVLRTGDDVALIAWGKMVNFCIEASEQLSRSGVAASVVDVRTLAPLDTETLINAVRTTGHAVVVHEAVGRGGYGGEIAAGLHEALGNDLRRPVVRVTGEDVPLPMSPVLERAALPSVEKIVAAALDLVG